MYIYEATEAVYLRAKNGLVFSICGRQEEGEKGEEARKN